MSKDLSAGYHQKTNKQLKKILQKISKSYCRKKRENKNMVANNIRVSQKPKNKYQLSIEKGILKCETTKFMRNFRSLDIDFLKKVKEILVGWKLGCFFQKSIKKFFVRGNQVGW